MVVKYGQLTLIQNFKFISISLPKMREHKKIARQKVQKWPSAWESKIKCCINNKRPTGQKHTNFRWDDGGR